jgi:hypothetical protein
MTTVRGESGIEAVMGKKKEIPRRHREFEDEANGAEESSWLPTVDPDERDEYDEWRKERGSRGRKRRDKAGGRHRRHRVEDE